MGVFIPIGVWEDIKLRYPDIENFDAPKEKKELMQAVAECNATTVEAFFDELDSRIKKRYNNVQSICS